MTRDQGSMESVNGDPASAELERRSKYLSSLIERTRIKPPAADEVKNKDVKDEKTNEKKEEKKVEEEKQLKVRVRASDMSLPMQRRAVACAREAAAAMTKIDSKRLALALKKEFDASYGPAWHCIVGTSFGSYVTHSVGSFLYFSIDKVYILLFRTAVEPLDH